MYTYYEYTYIYNGSQIQDEHDGRKMKGIRTTLARVGVYPSARMKGTGRPLGASMSGTLFPPPPSSYTGCLLRNLRKSVTVGVFKSFHMLKTRESFQLFYDSLIRLIALYKSNISQSLTTVIVSVKKSNSTHKPQVFNLQNSKIYYLLIYICFSFP